MTDSAISLAPTPAAVLPSTETRMRLASLPQRLRHQHMRDLGSAYFCGTVGGTPVPMAAPTGRIVYCDDRARARHRGLHL